MCASSEKGKKQHANKYFQYKIKVASTEADNTEINVHWVSDPEHLEPPLSSSSSSNQVYAPFLGDPGTSESPEQIPGLGGKHWE